MMAAIEKCLTRQRELEAKKGEGGEQGDPVMPALYAMAQQPALHEVQPALREGEAIPAYLDDIYIVAVPERVRELYERYRAALWSHARVELNFGKTRIWNAAGAEPRHIADLQQGGLTVAPALRLSTR